MKRVLKLDSNFSSAHLYRNDLFSKKENQKEFGRCFSNYGHGHNYKIEVGFHINNDIKDPELIRLQKSLKQKLNQLTDHLDFTHLNFVIPEFKNTVPTTENILLYFEKKLCGLKLKNSLVFIKLFETENLWSEKYYVTV